MKRIKLWLLGMMAVSVNLWACDLCNYYMNVTPHDYRNTIGFRYRYSAYQNHEQKAQQLMKSMHHTETNSTEVYNSYELWGQFYVKPEIELNVLVPFKHNCSGSDRFLGIGDAMFTLQYRVLNQREENQHSIRQHLYLGGGIKIPTGQFHRSEDPHLQTGSESLDFLLTGSYGLRIDQWGLQGQMSYSVTQHNRDDFKFANRLNVTAVVFRQFVVGETTVMPLAGTIIENAGKDVLNNDYLDGTGGTHVLWQAGAQVYWKNVALQGNISKPIFETTKFSKNTYRIMTGLSYSF